MKSVNAGKTELQKQDILDLVNTMKMFGDVIHSIGTIEKKIGTFEHFNNVLEENISTITEQLEDKPEIAQKLGNVFVKFITLSNYMKSDFSEVPPDDKIKAGLILKEISEMLKELVELRD